MTFLQDYTTQCKQLERAFLVVLFVVPSGGALLRGKSTRTGRAGQAWLTDFGGRTARSLERSVGPLLDELTPEEVDVAALKIFCLLGHPAPIAVVVRGHIITRVERRARDPKQPWVMAPCKLCPDEKVDGRWAYTYELDARRVFSAADRAKTNQAQRRGVTGLLRAR